MQLAAPFVKLPFTFDVAQLTAEISALGEDIWRAHPEGHPGNSAAALLSPHGDPDSDGVAGPMLCTPALASMPYVQQVLAAFDAPMGRARLMRIEGLGHAKRHVDTNYYWFDRMRVHIPIVTHQNVEFICGDESVHMAAGESWIFDTWRLHDVINHVDQPRIHLVADTVGSPSLWRAINNSLGGTGHTPAFVPFRRGGYTPLRVEQFNAPVVMSPGDQASILARLRPDIDAGAPSLVAADRFLQAWRGLWAQYGPNPVEDYEQAIKEFEAELDDHPNESMMANNTDVAFAFRQLLIAPALQKPTERPAARPRPTADPRFAAPVIIISPPRAGSTLLFETLAEAPEVFTIGGESHALIEQIDALNPENKSWASNRLTAEDATVDVAKRLRDAFFGSLRDRNGNPIAPNSQHVRFLEKTPKNALRIPFLRNIFPDARFVYLTRDPRHEIASMIDAWQSGKFVTYPNLPAWTGLPWSLLLVPGWKQLIGRPIAEIAAHQWAITTNAILDDLARLPATQWAIASYEQLVAEPDQEIDRLRTFTGLQVERNPDAPLPLSRYTLTPPDPDKWRFHEAEIEKALPSVGTVIERLNAVIEAHSASPTIPFVAPEPRTEVADDSFSSAHTASFAALLAQAGASIAVTTYQSGRLILLRPDGDVVNTHFRVLQRPMGLATGPDGRLAIGTHSEVWEYRDQPAVAAKLEPAGSHDACYIVRNRHTTGDISIHEMGYVGNDLWFVNTRFSCLATLGPDHSFIPRWSPAFITAIVPEDRCHLNGMAMVDGVPRFVTVLGITDTAGGWRANKADGGCIIDVSNNAVVTTGLSMPHSPRVYRGKLWVLQSGNGTLCTVDEATGETTTVGSVPGFARGLAFIDRYAIIGLSQVRESVFAGLPLTKSTEPRHCGVWVLDIETGETVAFLRFQGIVQEVFDVQVFNGLRRPDVAEPVGDVTANSFVLP